MQVGGFTDYINAPSVFLDFIKHSIPSKYEFVKLFKIKQQVVNGIIYKVFIIVNEINSKDENKILLMTILDSHNDLQVVNSDIIKGDIYNDHLNLNGTVESYDTTLDSFNKRRNQFYFIFMIIIIILILIYLISHF